MHIEVVCFAATEEACRGREGSGLAEGTEPAADRDRQAPGHRAAAVCQAAGGDTDAQEPAGQEEMLNLGPCY